MTTHLDQNDSYIVNRIVLNPQEKIDATNPNPVYLTFVSGTGLVKRGQQEMKVSRESNVIIRKNETYHIENTCNGPLTFIEIQIKN